MYEITFLITMQLQQWWLIPLLPAFSAFPKTKTKEYSPGWGCGGEWCRMNDCNSNQFLYAIVIDNCSYWCGFVVHKLQRVPQMNFSNCIAYTHTHTRMWREREEREHPLGPPLAAGRVRPSSQSKSFSATDALPCDIGQVEQSYQQYLRRWDNAAKRDGTLV